MGINTRKDEDKDSADNMTQWFRLLCQIGINCGFGAVSAVALAKAFASRRSIGHRQ